jgi:hypothetical protein
MQKEIFKTSIVNEPSPQKKGGGDFFGVQQKTLFLFPSKPWFHGRPPQKPLLFF